VFLNYWLSGIRKDPVKKFRKKRSKGKRRGRVDFETAQGGALGAEGKRSPPCVSNKKPEHKRGSRLQEKKGKDDQLLHCEKTSARRRGEEKNPTANKKGSQSERRGGSSREKGKKLSALVRRLR